MTRPQGGGIAALGSDPLAVGFLKALEDDSCHVRSQAAIALGKLGWNDAEIRERLTRILLDRRLHAHESSDAALALGMIHAGESSGRIAETLAGGRTKEELRIAAAVALGVMRDPAYGSVLERVVRNPEEDEEVQAAAVLALGLLGDERACGTLFQVLLGSPRDALRAMAVAALAKSGFREIVLRQGSKSRTVDVVALFEDLIGKPQTPPAVRRALALALGPVGRLDSTGSVLERIVKGERDETVQGFALLSLAWLGREHGDGASVREPLERAVRAETDERVRGFAVLALGLSGDAQAGPLLREIFNGNDSSEIRAAAAVGLGVLKHKAAIADLAGEVENPRDGGDARGYAAVALGMIGDPGSSAYLKWILENSNEPYLKWASSQGLALLGDRSAIPLVLACLDDKNLVTREAAVRALAYFRDDATVAPLLDRFRTEKSETVRLAIVRTLGAVADRSGREPVARRIGRDVDWVTLRRMVVLSRIASLY